MPNTPVLLKFNAKPHLDITFDNENPGTKYRFAPAKFPLETDLDFGGGEHANVNANSGGNTSAYTLTRTPDFGFNTRFEKSGFGHIQFSTLIRELGDQDDLDQDHHVLGWGVNRSTGIDLTENDSVQILGVYGKNTGSTPDGRRAGEPFAPGAKPMHGRDCHGWLASCLFVARLAYDEAQDGISYTLSVVPQETRQGEDEAVSREIGALDMYFGQGGFHLNLNVLLKETLLDAMEHPDKYPQLTIRVSGYTVNFVRLTRKQQLDVINRSFFHGSI